MPHLPNSGETIPVSLLTGFLGSGKTTVLNHLLKSPALTNTAVIINEFGEIGLDHELVEATKDDIVLLESGCLCCTVRGDLIRTLHTLFYQRQGGQVPRFERVAIETTGLADPGPILQTLMTDPMLSEHFSLDGVIATVDAVNGERTLDQHIEALKQVAMADRLVLTKTDLAAPASIAALQKRLMEISPGADVSAAINGAVDAAGLLNAGRFDPRTKTIDVQEWLRADAFEAHRHQHDPRRRDVNRHDRSIRAFCLTVDDPVPDNVLDLWLQTMMALKGPDILRLKAIVHVAGMPGPVIIHGVQHIFHPPVVMDAWPSTDHRTRIVLIVRNPDAKLIKDSLAFLRDYSTATGAAPLNNYAEAS